MDNIMTPRIELAVRSINASSRRDVASVTANYEREEHIGISALYGNVFDRESSFRELKLTRGFNPDKVSEFPVP